MFTSPAALFTRARPDMRSRSRRWMIQGLAAAAIVLAACEGAPGAGSAAEAPSPTVAAIDSLVADAMRDGKVPGLALTIVRGDTVIHSRGYGFASLEQQRPMTDTTPVVIGSTSKTFTALAIMQLADAGRVALDSGVARYVGLLGAPTGAARVVARVTPADARVPAITVRQLLTNVGGIPAGFAGDPFDQLDTAVTALESLVRDDILTRPLDFAPGTGYTYSNRGFSLASLVVQDASGESYEDYVMRHIFQPLGMRHSTGRFWEGPARGVVQGYRESVDGRPLPRPAALGRAHTGSGMILSTSRDAGRYLSALIAGGRAADGTRILSERGTAELLRPQQKAESELGGPTTYALGWESHDAGGTPMLLKGGSVIAMGSLFVIVPQSRTGIAMVFNAVDYGKLQLLQNLLKQLARAPTAPYQSAPPPAPVAPARYRATPAQLQDVAGDYVTRAGLMRIVARGDSLHARYQGLDLRLEPVSDTSFVMRSDVRELEGSAVVIKPCGPTKCAWMHGDSSAVRR